MKQTAVKKVAAKKAVKKPATAAGKPVTVTLTKEDHYTPPAPSITIKAYSEELVNELLKKVQERPIERYDGAIAKTQSMDKPLSPTPKKMSELDNVISSISSQTELTKNLLDELSIVATRLQPMKEPEQNGELVRAGLMEDGNYCHLENLHVMRRRLEVCNEKFRTLLQHLESCI